MIPFKLNFELTFCLLMLCFLCEESFGYIDPNSGYIVWQIIFGSLVGVLFFAKKIWHSIRGVFIKKETSDSLTSQN